MALLVVFFAAFGFFAVAVACIRFLTPSLGSARPSGRRFGVRGSYRHLDGGNLGWLDLDRSRASLAGQRCVDPPQRLLAAQQRDA
ncbi:MAG: hypothetical protein ACYDC2_11150, partial [Solirubrobacteraceae bacterium]